MTTLMSKPVSEMDQPYSRRWAALGVLCLSLLIVVMANTALIVAAPDMTRDLGLTSTQLQWVIDGYTVPYAALMLLFGVIGDKYSRRGALLAGLAVFAGGAVFGSIADTTNAVIAARMIMGVGAAIIMPATLSLLVATFPKAERSRAIAAWAATSGLAIALGPLLAGWILDSHSWSITFLINVPIAAVAAVAAVILVPPSKAEHLGRIDWIGGRTLGGHHRLARVLDHQRIPLRVDGGPIGAAVLAAIGLVSFVVWELRHPQPLLDVRKLGQRMVGGATLAVLLLFLAAFGAIYFISQQFQFILGYGALETGVRLLPLAIAVSIGAVVSGRITPLIGVRASIVGGMVVAAIGVLILTQVDGDSGYWMFAVPLILLGLGIGLSEPPATDAIMDNFSEDDLGAAGGPQRHRHRTRRLAGYRDPRLDPRCELQGFDCRIHQWNAGSAVDGRTCTTGCVRDGGVGRIRRRRFVGRRRDGRQPVGCSSGRAVARRRRQCLRRRDFGGQLGGRSCTVRGGSCRGVHPAGQEGPCGSRPRVSLTCSEPAGLRREPTRGRPRHDSVEGERNASCPSPSITRSATGSPAASAAFAYRELTLAGTCRSSAPVTHTTGTPIGNRCCGDALRYRSGSASNGTPNRSSMKLIRRPRSPADARSSAAACAMTRSGRVNVSFSPASHTARCPPAECPSKRI